MTISRYLKVMAKKRLKMTKKAIASRRRYRLKKKGAGFGPRSTTGFQSQSLGSRRNLMEIIKQAK